MDSSSYSMVHYYDRELNALVINYTLAGTMASKSLSVKTSPGFVPNEFMI